MCGLLTNTSFLCLLLMIVAPLLLEAAPRQQGRAEEPKIWALLAAGSNGYWNYGLQGDVCHAYQVLKAHGVPDENIVVMMYDDIANDPENPTPGIVVNYPNGSDVYAGVPKDYTGEDVTVENVLNILGGKKEAMKGVGSGKVIESGPDDHVFIFLDSHGDTGMLVWMESELTSIDLNDALKSMHQENRYGKVVVHIDSCMAGSMVSDDLPQNISVFATTSSKPDELSYFCYYDPDRFTYVASCYSAHWMEDSDAHEDLNNETLQAQFDVARRRTDESHPMEYGDLKLSKLPVGEFEGEEEATSTAKNLHRPRRSIAENNKNKGIARPNAALDILFKNLAKAKNEQDAGKIRGKIDQLIQKQKNLETTLSRITTNVATSMEQQARLLSPSPKRVTNTRCHHNLVKAFGKNCPSIREAGKYGFKFAGVFANMCNEGLDEGKVIAAMKKVCSSP